MQQKMSSGNINKRRCIVQKLDFENCIVTNIKTRARGRKKLRARISREISDISKEIQLFERQSSNVSPALTQAVYSEVAEPTSPVLIKNQCKEGGNHFFSKRKKLNSPERGLENLSKTSTNEEIPSSPGSPVFKTCKKHKVENVLLNTIQGFQSVSETTTNIDVVSSRENSSSDRQTSFQIDDFTQESKQSIKISSVDSAELKKDNFSDYSIEKCAGELNTFSQCSPAELSNDFDIREKHFSPKPLRRNYKKNSLLGRLHKLQKKQASEKLLWQHQNRKKSPGSVKVLIVDFWKEEFNYFLKCQSVLPDFEKTFLIVDSRWAPNVKKVRENSVLQLHPPWQTLTVEDPMMTVLLNVICLDILDETKEPIVQKRTYELIPTNRFETDKRLFIESLFFSCKSGFLC